MTSETPAVTGAAARPAPRLLCPRPAEVVVHGTLDELLPPDHPARNVRAFVGSLDLSELLACVRSVEGHAGRPAVDPRLLLELWLFATAQGVCSSRQLATLCKEHLAYRWLAGGVRLEYHSLADFRTGNGELLDRLLADTIAVMLEEGLIDLDRVAQDGMRVRACAGSSSFRGQSLQRCLEEARRQVELLRRAEGEDQGAANRRAAAAQARAARERSARLEAARAELARLRQANAEQPPSRRKPEEEIRASTTDPECRKMKMADGGFRPAYNVQFATTTVGGAVVGVGVTNEGADGGQLGPMLDRIERDHGGRPGEALVDGGYVTVQGIDAAERSGTKVYAPVKIEEKQKGRGEDPFERKKSDTELTAVWRARMGTQEAKGIYKERGQTAEWVNAGARNRGMYRLNVRGLAKALVVALWQALAHNMLALARLRRAAAVAAA
jgi:transposase